MLEPPHLPLLDAPLLPGSGSPLLLPVLCVDLLVVDVQVLLKRILVLIETHFLPRLRLQIFEGLLWFDKFMSFGIELWIVSH